MTEQTFSTQTWSPRRNLNSIYSLETQLVQFRQVGGSLKSYVWDFAEGSALLSYELLALIMHLEVDECPWRHLPLENEAKHLAFLLERMSSMPVWTYHRFKA